MFIPTIFLFLFFSSSETHQSHNLDGCQAIGKTSSFIETFWAFGFLWSSYHSISLSSLQWSSSSCYNFICCCVTNQLGMYSSDHGHTSRALVHISCVLKWSGSWPIGHGQSRAHISCIIYWSGIYFSMFVSSPTAFLHISWVFKLLGTYANNHGYMLTAFSFVSRVFKLSGTYFNNHGSTSRALIHISCVFKWSGRNSKKRGSRLTSLLRASWTPGIYFSILPKTCTTKKPMISG